MSVKTKAQLDAEKRLSKAGSMVQGESDDPLESEEFDEVDEVDDGNPKFHPKKLFSMVWHNNVKNIYQNGSIFNRATKEFIEKVD